MRLFGTLAGLVTSAFMTAQATAQENLEPYRCPEPTNSSAVEAWKNSEARATLIDNGGSAARIARGKTYAAFMDSLWSDIENRFSENRPTTTAELFDGIGESYKHAYRTSAGASLKHGVTPELFLDSAFRNRTADGQLNDNDIVLTPSDFDGETLSQNTDLQNLLPLDSSLDNGIEISIRFMPTWGDYAHMSIAKGLGQHTALSNEGSLESLLGFTKADDYNIESYWDEINIKDNIICPEFN